MLEIAIVFTLTVVCLALLIWIYLDIFGFWD